MGARTHLPTTRHADRLKNGHCSLDSNLSSLQHWSLVSLLQLLSSTSEARIAIAEISVNVCSARHDIDKSRSFLHIILKHLISRISRQDLSVVFLSIGMQSGPKIIFWGVGKRRDEKESINQQTHMFRRAYWRPRYRRGGGGRGRGRGRGRVRYTNLSLHSEASQATLRVVSQGFILVSSTKRATKAFSISAGQRRKFRAETFFQRVFVFPSKPNKT